MDTRVLIFGDSIVWGASDQEGGWATRIKNYVDRKRLTSGYASSVYVLGVSGDNSEDLLKRFEFETKTRLRDETDVYIIFAIGVNDSQVTKDTQANTVPLQDFGRNLQKLVDTAKKYAKQVIIIGLTPIDEKLVYPMPWKTSHGYLSAEVAKYDKELQKIASANDIQFIDMFSRFSEAGYEKLLFDGLHPNTQGHELMYKKIISYLLDNKII